MRKNYFLAGMAAMMLASCSSDKLGPDPTPSQPTLEAGAVGFDAYTQRSTTRAGETGVMNLTKLQTSHFGVFAYYTDNNDYDPQALPNFFYNQEVEWDGSSWTYDPVKYWPNEYGTTAISDDADKVSFFAYAPFVDVIPSSGKLNKVNADDDKWGITGLSRNSSTGDPLVKYIASFDADKTVDLMWGVCDQPNDWTTVQTGSTKQINSGVLGLPWLNVERPLVDQRLKFTFKHALAQLSVNVDAFVDGVDASNELGEMTRIYVRSISFTGMATKGSLNLNNTEKDKALWLDYNGTADLESGETVIVYDGRKDGKEGATGATAANEKTLGLNPDVIQTESSIDYTDPTNPAWASASPGVNKTLRNLFKGTDPIYIIPTGEENIEVEIVYDVETLDKNLANYVSDARTNGSTIENRIKKSVKFGNVSKYESGKHYTINLHLGMNSVKLDADITDWQEADSQADPDLPSNVPQFAAGTTTAVTIPADITSYQFAVSGLNGGSTVTATQDGTVVTGVTTAAANASGVAVETATIAANNTVKNVYTGTFTITGKVGDADKATTVNITQMAHPLNLSVYSVSADGKEIQLASGALAIGTDWFANETGGDPATIHVYKNGTELTKVATPAADGQYSYTATSGLITLYTEAKAGDTYTIKLKTGDASEETAYAKIGGIAFVPATRSLVYKGAAYTEVYSPIYYGAAPTSYTWTPTTGTNASVDANGQVTTLKAGTEVIQAVSDQTAADGWFYTDNSKTSTYTLTVTKQNATISFTSAPTSKTTTEMTSGYTLAATQTGVLGDTPTATVTYSITNGTGNVATYTVDATGAVSVSSGTSTAGDTFTVTATVDAEPTGDQYKFTTRTASYTVTVTD